MHLTRRRFLGHLPLAALGSSLALRGGADPGTDPGRIRELIEANRPSRLARLPADFAARFGSTHSNGKYCLSDRPFLLEGAQRLLDLGARLGKFWFEPGIMDRVYPFHSAWPRCSGLVELAQCEYFEQVWRMPFETIFLESYADVERGWRKPGLPGEFYARVTEEYYGIACHLLQRFRERRITVVLQNWEGDWLLRGIGAAWNPPPPDWRERCDQMRRWLAARQAGVERARREHGAGSRCTVAHAVEVNRVADAWKGIPTVTREVLPGVEVDLVSHSAYDGINSGDPVLFWRCLEEIRAHARTGSLFGPGALAVGEYGIPENDKPERVRERFDEMLGVMLALGVRYAAHWQLYCNEFAGRPAVPPAIPVSDPARMRGFWLVRPDGSLSEGGAYFHGLWTRAARESGAGGGGGSRPRKGRPA